MKTFEESYKQLNPEQKKAVDAIDGPVMVVAGPGTGKTQILTLRIANILHKTDTNPENILALTFTESGVNAMRKRLASIIGSLAYQVQIYTFHSFANDIILQNPEEFPTIIGSRAITDIDQISLIEEILLSRDFELIKPFGDSLHYSKALLGNINTLKSEGVTISDFEKIVTEAEREFADRDDIYNEKGAKKGELKTTAKTEQKKIKKNRELLEVYIEYQTLLRKKKWYDYSDMIVELLVALRTRPDLLMSLQEKHQYILVDEHQDSNNAQNKILELLANFHEEPNLFVVGDEKQSIYRFQGASLENFFYFKHLYPNAVLITLSHNYRSTQSILDTAHSLVAGEVPLLSHSSADSRPITLAPFESSKHELVWVAEQIQRLLRDGVEGHEIAVLYRNNSHSNLVSEIFSKHTIPHTVESDQNLFRDSSIVKFLDILYCINNPSSDEFVARILLSDVFSIDPLIATRLIQSASQKRKKLLIEMLLDEKLLKTEGFSEESIESLVELGNNISVWTKKSHNTGLLEILEIISLESGFLNYLVSSEKGIENIDVLGILFDEARSFLATKEDAKLSDFLKYIDLLKTHELSIKKKVGRIKEGNIRLMTAHKSKGLEFDFVFIIGVNNGVWGNKVKRNILPLLPKVFTLFDTPPLEISNENQEDYDLAEERRLLFVALTRARKHLTISYSLTRDDGKEILPSQFIGEIREDLVELIDTTDFLASWPEKQMMLFNPSIALTLGIDEYKEQMKAFVRERLASQGLSVSALNNYLKSPWLYFFRSLVRIPSAMNKHLGFGNAVHKALEDFFNESRGEKYPELSFLLFAFTRALDEKAEVPYADYEDVKKKGEKVLTNWYNEYQGSWNLDTRTEFRIRGITLPHISEEIELHINGSLDKIEFNNDSHTRISVVDYKTGKPKTEGEVRGTTKNSDGEYYRQLVFYKLLLKYFNNGAMVMEKGILEFIEPEDDGRFRRYEFEISDEEVENLEKQIGEVISEIVNLSFWDIEVNEHSEEYKTLVSTLRR